MLIFVNGGNKTGSSWAYGIINEMVEPEPVPDAFNNPGWWQDTVFHPLLADFLGQRDYSQGTWLIKSHFKTVTHRDYLLAHPDVRVVDTTRDIRDVLVSAYHHKRNYDGYDDDFQTYFWNDGSGRVSETSRYYRVWDVEHPNLVSLSYSQLHSDFESSVIAIADLLGLPLDQEEISRIEQATNFAGQKAFNPKHFRKGVIGDWQNYFDEDIQRRFDTVLADSTKPWNAIPSGLDRDTLREDLKRAASKTSLSRRDPSRVPTISVVTPVFNDAEHIAETIESVLDQDYPDLEYVVMDGGSTDGSAEIVKKYEQHLTYWQSEPDGGHARAVNAGFEHTTGQIMCWLNSADLYYPSALRTVGQVFSDFEDVEWLQGLPNFIAPDGSTVQINKRHGIWCRHDYLSSDVPHMHIQQEATFWTRRLWEIAGPLNTEYSLANDCELWMRFFRYATLQNITTLLGGFRIHEGQRSVDLREPYEAEATRALDTERRRLGITKEDAAELRKQDEALRPPIRYDVEQKEYVRDFQDHFRAPEPWPIVKQINTHRNALLRQVSELRGDRDRKAERIQELEAELGQLRQDIEQTELNV